MGESPCPPCAPCVLLYIARAPEMRTVFLQPRMRQGCSCSGKKSPRLPNELLLSKGVSEKGFRIGIPQGNVPYCR